MRFHIAWVCLIILIWLTPCFAGHQLLYDVYNSSIGASEDLTVFNQSISISGKYDNITLEMFVGSSTWSPKYTLGITDNMDNIIPDCLVNISYHYLGARQNLTFPIGCILEGNNSYGQFKVKFIKEYPRVGINLPMTFDINTANPYSGGQFFNPYGVGYGYGNYSDAVFRLWVYDYISPEPTCDQYYNENMTGATGVGGNFAVFLCKITEPSVEFVVTTLIVIFVCMLLFAISMLLLSIIRQAH